MLASRQPAGQHAPGVRLQHRQPQPPLHQHLHHNFLDRRLAGAEDHAPQPLANAGLHFVQQLLRLLSVCGPGGDADVNGAGVSSQPHRRVGGFFQVGDLAINAAFADAGSVQDAADDNPLQAEFLLQEG